jgi:ferredoxin-NADP reductase/uncharacterized protein YndB with AHSA1/START domain
MAHVKQTCSVQTTIQKLWQAFTDASTVQKWSGESATIDAREGGVFSMLGGNVHGTITKIESNKLLRQDWYGDDHPDRKYDVSFTFDFDDYKGEAMVTVEHEASEDDAQTMSDGWQKYYFEPIKKLLGYQKAEGTLNIKLHLVKKEHVVDNVWSFIFKPSQPLSWTAGQFIWVELPHDNPDGEGDRRWFTIASAPYEQMVQITTRISDSTFKQALAALPDGGELNLLEKPDGDFIWQDSERPLVFVAGGIGITAFHSILKQRVHDKLPLPATLIYGNRDENVPFKKVLEQWAASDERFKIQYVTGMPLTAEGLAKLKPDLNDALVYISGPEKMVKDLGDDLLKHGLPQSQLRLDALKNYEATNY